MELAHTKTQLNKEKNRFELKLEKDLAFIEFKVASKGDIYMVHTEVP
jgi:hypothetical protein